MKKAICLIVIVSLALSMVSINASATELSDTVFAMTSTNLSSAKSATFTALTYQVQSSIKVTMVRLYKQNGNLWTYMGTLPVPTYEATNTKLFGTQMDYSNYIGTGTYRILTTFTADGHSISRYSNTITY